MVPENINADLAKGELLLTQGGGEPYKLVEEGEPLLAHISSVKKGEGKNFETGEPEPRLIVGYKLDETGQAQGQVYNVYYKVSMNEKSNLFKAVSAIFGKVDFPFDPTTLLDKPCRIMLETYQGKTGEDRQKVKSVLKAKPGQTIPTPKVEEADQILTAEDFDNMFGGAA